MLHKEIATESPAETPNLTTVSSNQSLTSTSRAQTPSDSATTNGSDFIQPELQRAYSAPSPKREPTSLLSSRGTASAPSHLDSANMIRQLQPSSPPSSSPTTDDVTSPPKPEQTSPSSSWTATSAKFTLAAVSSLTFSLNTISGAYVFCAKFDTSYTAPSSFSDLIRHGLNGIPYPVTGFAFLAAGLSQAANMFQCFDFGPRMRNNFNNHLKPVLNKLWGRHWEDMTRKDYMTLGGMGLAVTAAAGAGKLAWDSTADSPEWYFRYLMGSLGVLSIFGMNFLTRGVSTKTAIDNMSFAYSDPDKAKILELTKKLYPIETDAQHNQLPDASAEKTITAEFQEAKAALTTLFDQYGITSPTDMDKVLSAYFTLLETQKEYSYLLKRRTHQAFVATFVLTAWAIYMEKLASIFTPFMPKDEGAVEDIIWDTIIGLGATIGASPHAFLFYYSAKNILSTIKDSFIEAPGQTTAWTLAILLTSFGMFNVAIGIANNDPLVPLPKPETPYGWIGPILAFMSAFWVNLSSTLKMTTLKEKIATDSQLLAENPYHQLLEKITHETPSNEEIAAQTPSSAESAPERKLADAVNPHVTDSHVIDVNQADAKSQPVATATHSKLSQAVSSFCNAQAAITQQGLFKKTYNPEGLTTPLLAGERSRSDDTPKVDNRSYARQSYDYIRSWCGARPGQ
jgi:hypothetical protein